MDPQDISSLPFAPYNIHDLQVSGFVVQKEIEQTPFLIGRRSDCHLVLNHPQVSAVHARLIQQNGQTIIEDLNSAEGTYVAQQLISKETVRPSYTIMIL